MKVNLFLNEEKVDTYSFTAAFKVNCFLAAKIIEYKATKVDLEIQFSLIHDFINFDLEGLISFSNVIRNEAKNEI